MMVGGIDKQIYLPYQLAQSLGFYKKYGVNMTLSTEQNGGVGAEDAMASGQVDMAGAWYIHTIDFQSKGKDVINLVQLSGAPGEREMCSTKSGVHVGGRLQGQDARGHRPRLRHRRTHPVPRSRRMGITHKQYHDPRRRRRCDRDRGDPARYAPHCVMTTQPTVGALETKNLADHRGRPRHQPTARQTALGGAWPAAGVLARADWVKAHKDGGAGCR